MNSLKDHKFRKAVVLIIISLFTAIVFVDRSVMGTSWSLLPPMLAIFVAFVSGRLGLSLFSAVLLGAFLNFYGESQRIFASLTSGLYKVGQYFLGALVGNESASLVFYSSGWPWMEFVDKFSVTNIQILGFVFCVLSMVQVMIASGGLHAMVEFLQRFVIGPRSAQMMTYFLGCLIFIDDYANTMIVGSAMQKVTDRYGISREKLAFIVDATSAPIAGVALVSTWIGYEVGLFNEMASKFSWGIDGYSVFLQALPFRFYCFIMLIFVFLNIAWDVDFGPMKKLRRSKISFSSQSESVVGSLWTALAPLIGLLLMVFVLLWYDGGGAIDRTPWSLSDWRAVLTQSENGILILLVSSFCCYLLTVLLSFLLSEVQSSVIFKAMFQGLKSSLLPMGILLLAWSLKSVCDDLNTGEFVASQLSGQIPPIALPIAIFIVSALTAFSTGTSWGTMAILIPTVTPLALNVAGGEYSLYVALCLAAILDGAIMGDHCSPISDTTIMSSISTDCDLLSHVRTQLPYSLVVGSIALIFGYIPAGLGWSLWWSLGAALFLLVALFFVLKTYQRKKGTS